MEQISREEEGTGASNIEPENCKWEAATERSSEFFLRSLLDETIDGTFKRGVAFSWVTNSCRWIIRQRNVNILGTIQSNKSMIST